MRKFIIFIAAIFIFIPFSYGEINVLKDFQAAAAKIKAPAAGKEVKELLKKEQAGDAEIQKFIRAKMAAYKKHLIKTAKTDSFTDFAKLEAADAVGASDVYECGTTDGRTVLRTGAQLAVIAFLNENMRARNYKVLTGYADLVSKIPKGTQVILGGEVHGNNSVLAAAGFIISLRKNFNLGHVASEFLTTNLRGGLERYNKTGDLSEITMSANHALLGTDEINEFVAAASKGLDIIPLEDVEADFGGIKVDGKINTPRVFDDFLEIQKSGGGLDNFFVSNIGMAARNKIWITRMQPVLDAMKAGRENKTMFVYGGLGHIQYSALSGSLADRIMARGLKTVNILFFADDKDFSVLGKNFKGDARFLFAVPEDRKSELGVDFIVLYKEFKPESIVF